ALGEKAAAEADGDGFGAGARLKPAEHGADMALAGLFGDEQALRDLAVAQAVGDQLQDLELPGVGGVLAVEGAQHASGVGSTRSERAASVSKRSACDR